MTPSRWQQIEELYHAALECEPGERVAFLAQVDPELRQEVESLLAQQTGATPLDHPAWEAAASLLESTVAVLTPGTQLGPYKIEGPLGSGGMGEVFRGFDTRLNRPVAIKLLSASFSSSDARRRFQREAQMASALNHPNILTVHDVGESAGRRYLVSELVDGGTLKDWAQRQHHTWRETVELLSGVASGLAAAHQAGILHRDIKPANILIARNGHAKLADFGLARLAETSRESFETGFTQTGAVLGTPAYMSPEQAAGKPLTASSDIFSFGIVLFETLCGSRPFVGDTAVETLAAIVNSQPPAPRTIRPEIPVALERIVLRCLEKNPDARYSSADLLHDDLQQLLIPSSTSVPWKRLAVAAGILIIAVIAFFGWRVYRHDAQVRWVEETAAPQIAQLIEHDRMLAAATLYREAEQIAPESKSLYRLTEGVASHSATFETMPPGAEVYIQDYSAAPGDDLSQWRSLGISPATITALPKAGYYRLRLIKKGYAPVDLAMDAYGPPVIRLSLRKPRDVPEGTVWVDPTGSQPGFWLDRFEVTNEQFQKFVEAGGYHRPELWKQPFVGNGKRLSFDQAMALFRDRSGRPGPSTWNLGHFPDDARTLPVTGVSWYEAAAYAEFTKKALPTFNEWNQATQVSYYSHIVPVSNFSGKALARPGTYRGPVPAGAYDLAGNAKEWIFTAADERHYILGGAWDEPAYSYTSPDARDPFARAANFGFRCVLRPQAPPATAFAPVAMPFPQPTKKPVDDRIYNIYAGLHAYTRSPLDSRLERTDDTPAHWRSETVSFRAAYGRDRVIAHLFLPKSGKPPFQVVMVMGGVSIMGWKRIEDYGLPYEFLALTGRAVVIPAYAGTLERGPSPFDLPVNEERDRAIKWSMDLSRSLDYLESRSDVDMGKVAFYGISMGGTHGPRFLALEPRLKAAVLVSAGIFTAGPDETNAWNFAPRVHSPVLMLGGRYGFIANEATQTLLFRELGTKEPDKKFVQFEGGHINLVTRPDLLGEILNWLDHYLGPVRP